MMLELVARRSGGLSNAEIGRYFNVATSTCSYILSRLESHGYIKRDRDTGRYEIGIKIAGLAHSVQQDNALRSILLPALHSLVKDTRLTAAVGVLRHGRVLLVGHVDSPEHLRVHLSTGSEVEFDISALGKVLVAWLPAKELSQLIKQFGLSKANSRNNSRGINPPSKFIQEMDLVRKQGYAINKSIPEVLSMAVPILDAGGVVCAAVVVTGATTQMVWKRPRGLVDRLKAAAEQISSRTTSLNWLHLSA
jgi:DNA-binding IclR family transcriptional regulator